MNMMDRGRMATPPAPQPPSLRRLRIASVVLLLLSALCVAFIGPIHRVSIYAVAPVPVIMIAAIVSAAVYWYRRARLEATYWTPAREDAHTAAAIRSIHERRATRVGARQTEAGAAPSRRRFWWSPR